MNEYEKHFKKSYQEVPYWVFFSMLGSIILLMIIAYNIFPKK